MCVPVAAVSRDFTILMSVDDPAAPPGEGILCARYSGPPWDVGIGHVTCVQPPVLVRYLSVVADENPGLSVSEVQVFGQRT